MAQMNNIFYSMAMRSIWHLDLDCFFVSAERLRFPNLRGRPVAVGGIGARGVIASCSYEARKLGVRSAMPTTRALKLCPQIQICEPDHEYYSMLSKQVFELLQEFTPIYEVVSIDEAYLDMTGTEALFGPPAKAAAHLRAAIFKRTGLTASIGIAANRLVAKIATDLGKPDNVLEVPPGTEATVLAPHPHSRLPGCGRVTQAWLRERGIDTIGQLQRYPVDILEKHLGKFGLYLHESAWGRGGVEFHEEAKSRSISRETTFEKDIGDSGTIKQRLSEMASDLGRSLREENVYARGIRLKLRYPPFHTVLRSRVLKAPTQLDKTLFDAACALLQEHWEPECPLRLIGVGCFLGDGVRQLDLFEDHAAEYRQDKLQRLKDSLIRRFGDGIIKK